MPEFVNRAWGWFQTRPNIQKVVIVLAALVVLLLLSRVVSVIAAFVCLVALIGLVYAAVRRVPVRPWAIVAVGALVVTLVFGGLASAIYGPAQPDQAKAPRAQKPQPEKQQKPSAPPTNEGQAATPTPEPPAPEPKPAKKPEGPPKYSIVEVTIDKGGGPGSAAALQVIAPDVERGEEVARLAAADYAKHDYVLMDLYASKAKEDEIATRTPP
jgi:hypothetical protein